MKNNSATIPVMISARYISEHLQISYQAALKIIRYKLPYVKIGREYRVSETHYLNWLNGSEN